MVPTNAKPRMRTMPPPFPKSAWASSSWKLCSEGSWRTAVNLAIATFDGEQGHKKATGAPLVTLNVKTPRRVQYVFENPPENVTRLSKMKTLSNNLLPRSAGETFRANCYGSFCVAGSSHHLRGDCQTYIIKRPNERHKSKHVQTIKLRRGITMITFSLTKIQTLSTGNKGTGASKGSKSVPHSTRKRSTNLEPPTLRCPA